MSKALVKRHEDVLVDLSGAAGKFKRIDADISGIDLDTLTKMQENITQQDLAECSILPSEIEGVSNIPSMSNVELTAKCAVLQFEVKTLRGQVKTLIDVVDRLKPADWKEI